MKSQGMSIDSVLVLDDIIIIASKVNVQIETIIIASKVNVQIETF